MHRVRSTDYYVKQNVVISLLLLIPVLMATWLLMSSRTIQIGGEIINRVGTSEKVVALTFDDGPSSHTREITAILNNNGIKATFFLIGVEMQRWPGETKHLILEGHEIGNHGFHHTSLVFKSPITIKREVERTDQEIRGLGYNGPIPFRPPYGHKLIALPNYLSRHNRPTISRDVAPDTNNPEFSAEAIASAAIKSAKPGSIILLHAMYDHNQTSRDAVDLIIKALKANGYRFVTVSELLTHR